MDKNINERLFEQLMRAPHAVRRAAFEAAFGEERRECGRGHGPMHGPGHGGCRRHGHGPEDFREEGPGFGPEGCRREDRGRGPEGCRGRGHGPGRGPEHGRGPNPAFAREMLLDRIGGYEGGVRQKTLTEELRINPSSVSEMISKLESDGYVRRTVDPSDKRATLITLTELGEARAAELADERKGRLEKAFGSLTEEEKEQLAALLEKLTETR